MKSLFLFASMDRKQETSSLQNESLGFNLVNYFWNTCWSKNHSSLPLWARKAINLAKNCALLHLLETPTKFSPLKYQQSYWSIPESSNKEASSLLCGVLCFLPEIGEISLNSTCIPRCRKQLRYKFQINSLLQPCSPCIHHVFLVILEHNFSYAAVETSPLLHKPTITFVKFLIMSWNYHLCPSPVLMLHHQAFSDLCRINWWLVSCDSSWLIKIK